MPYKPDYKDKHITDNQRQATKQYDQQRGSANERGYNYQWQQIRTIKLNNDPLCELCLMQGAAHIATDVHHRDGNPKHNELYNLESLCHKCHSALTARTQGFNKPKG